MIFLINRGEMLTLDRFLNCTGRVLCIQGVPKNIAQRPVIHSTAKNKPKVVYTKISKNELIKNEK